MFDKLTNAPASVFKNVTTPVENQPEKQPEKPSGGIPGQVTEAEAMAGGKTAEYSDLQPNTGAGSQAPGPSIAAGNNGKLGHLLSAKTAIGIVDAVLPAIAVILLQHFFSIKLPKREVQLTESERNIISPVLQNWLDTVTINFDSPLNALLITVGAVYGSKFAEKGFTAYFDKRDADNAHAERMAVLKKETTPVVKEAPKVEIVKAGKIVPATTEETNQYGYTKEQMKTAKAALVKKGYKEPNSRQAAAWLSQNNIRPTA